ncbi:MAG: glycosyltransferase family 2 protein [Anaerolineales bacterium]
MNVAVIIPALNEAECIGALVRETFTQPLIQHVIVVDNGSTDGTGDVAQHAGAEVVREPRRGYGAACAAGVAAAEGAEVLAFMDADYSFLPQELPRVLAPVLEGRADLSLGSRVLGQVERGAMPPQQIFGNWLSAALIRWLYGVRVTDLGPFRAVRRSEVLALDMREMTYGWPTEMLVKMARRKQRIIEVPVSYHTRRTGESKVSGTLRGSVLAGYRILSATFRYAF